MIIAMMTTWKRMLNRRTFHRRISSATHRVPDLNLKKIKKRMMMVKKKIKIINQMSNHLVKKNQRKEIQSSHKRSRRSRRKKRNQSLVFIVGAKRHSLIRKYYYFWSISFKHYSQLWFLKPYCITNLIIIIDLVI